MIRGETDSLSLQDTFIFKKKKKKEKWADNRMFSHRSNLLVCVVSSRGKEVKVEAATEYQQWLNRSGLKGLLLLSTSPILCIIIREKSLKCYVHRLRTQPYLLYAPLTYDFFIMVGEMCHCKETKVG